MSGPKPLSNILAITPYKGGQKLDHGWKLSSNENPLGCSDKAVEALSQAARHLELYPDGSAFALRQAIGAKYDIDPDRIVCGAGSDEIFQLLGRAYLQPGDEVLQSAHGFLVYSLVAQQSGAKLVSAPEKDLHTDVDAMLERVTDKTKIVFLANPNNPTGSYIPYDEVKRLHAGLKEDVLLVLDGAYAEYVKQDDYNDGMEMARDYPNVLMTRTFSKIHVTSVAQAACLAALGDDAFVAKSVAHNNGELARMRPALEKMGFKVVPSVANFLLIDFGSEARAEAADVYLRSQGIVIRDMKAYGLAHCMRLSIGTTEANDDVLAAFDAFSKAS